MVKSLPERCMGCRVVQLSNDPSTSTWLPPWLPTHHHQVALVNAPAAKTSGRVQVVTECNYDVCTGWQKPSHMMTVGSSLGCAGHPATPLYSELAPLAAVSCGVIGSCGLYVSGEPGMGGEPVRIASSSGASWSVVARLP